MKQFIFFATLLTFFHLSAIEVKFATGEWTPYTSESMPNGGYVTEIIVAICKEAGIEPIFTYYPWTRAEYLVANGMVFGAYPYGYTEERTKKYKLTDPIIIVKNEFIYYSKNNRISKKASEISSIKNLEGFTVGQVIGGFGIEELTKLNITVEQVRLMEQLVLMLHEQRIDCIYGSPSVIQYTVKQLYPDKSQDFNSLPISFGSVQENGIIVSDTYPNSQEILNKFNNAFESIKKKGIYNATAVRKFTINTLPLSRF